ncbi:hypothetical protein GUITHDRAFT_135992 [Guillardia theta CCMP2712]|uniref:Uncharacterized protein n=1 Tax=Guillardia theta (strain CCMP2712) TaxID=905079 RepID=L1JLB4_GUITC|nr:hypothetical protein GUITHDRAFT_135992 [Guillardia theta CCMP2712]EKX49301.1 hypothetical protein GUITHDRAFT_135992 [Guillardia theta CCMP2712]|eukprot:XP_005836281.1 hypothetical protein GUITHDRAFT_135992 [Guillardia theta CCMP2712]
MFRSSFRILTPSVSVFLPAFSNETRQERRVAARGNEEEFQSDSEETHSSRMDSPLTQPDLLECDDDGDSQDSRDLQMEGPSLPFLATEKKTTTRMTKVTCKTAAGVTARASQSSILARWPMKPELKVPGADVRPQQDVDQLLDEVAAADVSGLKGRVWHSCFFGRPPSLHFLHDWYHNAGEVKSGDEDEKKEEGRKQEEATEETISESWSKKDGTSSWEDAWKDSRGRDLFSLLQEKGWMKLKMTNKSSQARRAHENAGYAVLRKDQNPTAARTSHFNCWWAHALSPHDSRWKKLQAHQKVNHFPGTFCIGRKDRLTRNLMRFKRRVGKDKCDFYPSTYILPASYTEFKNDFQSSKGVWIWKPCASARGIGIKIVTRLEQVSKKKPGLIQEYINSPLLINGFKFDLRVYVLATSFNPLKLYIFTNGLVRFSTKKYKRVRSDADMDAWTGSKWSIRALWRYLREELDYTQERVDKVWSDIRSVILRTFIAAESHININTSLLHLDRSNCFELWGVDILLDSADVGLSTALKPWLVEVNTSPDLSASSPLDKEIKGSLFTDTFTIVGAEVVKQKKHHGRSRDPQPETRVRPTGSADESRRKPSNNLQTTSTSWFSDLTPLDIQVLQQSEDEFRRQESTQFEILYPHPSMCEIYEPMFESSRSLNRLLHHWVKCRENPPPRLCELLDMKPSALHTRREEPQIL